jgi:light-regulated signal transduction histidine kinase (bacteriophytochrome)
VTDHADEIDAIAVGLNTLMEELKAANELKQKQIQQLENQKREIEQLIHSLKNNNNQLELSNNELDAFTYSVSHDLRAPLRAIHGYTNILLAEYADKLDNEGKEMMHSVSKNAKKMGQLIDDLLSFSKTGKRELQRVNMNMRELAEECITEMKRVFPFDNVSITVNPMPSAFADISMMRQVYLNLISNALKYSGKKEKIKIEIGARQEKGKTVYYIKDNGVGFDMKYYDKLFSVFSRLHAQEEFEGTGVGLALVKRIITKHGGSVWAEGKPNEGATFYFTLTV